MSEGARRYLGQLPEERDASRQARLMASAKVLFGSQGFAATSVDRICSEAKVSTRNFYQHFANKEAIFLAVYDDITSRSLTRAAQVLAETEGRPLVERVPRAFLAYMGPMIEDPQATRIAFVEIVGASSAIEETRLRYRESVVEIIAAEGRAAVERGEVQDRNWRYAALALAGSANAIVYDWTRQPEPDPVEVLEEVLATTALVLLTGPVPAMLK